MSQKFEIRCPTEARWPGDIIGCGSAKVAGPDEEGLYDCGNCGIWFRLESIKKTKFHAQNPRFVWNIGAIKESYPDMPDQGVGCILWDRQEQKPVVTLHADYANAFCLEITRPGMFPLTRVEEWFNQLSNSCLESEDITPTI
jgi:hypothetical protein